MDRNELLRDEIPENKDPQTILVSTWHPKLSAIPSILKNHILKNDIANQQLHSNVVSCGKCQTNNKRQIKHNRKNKRYQKLQGKGNN